MEIILYIAAIIVMIWSIAVQGRLKRLVTKYSKEQAASGKTANDCVREMLAMNDVYGVTMDHVGGELTGQRLGCNERCVYIHEPDFVAELFLGQNIEHRPISSCK